MSKICFRIILVTVIMSAAASLIRAQIASGGNYTLEQSVIAGGGAQNMAGGNFALDSTVGQSLANSAAATADSFALLSGFWTPAAAAAVTPTPTPPPDASPTPTSTPTPTPTPVFYAISGTVTNSNNSPRAGIALALACANPTLSITAITDIAGHYSFDNLAADANCTVVPVTQGFTYNPLNRSYANLAANVTGANFTITATSILISEFRLHGTNTTDEFVELYNSAATPVDISGWALVASNNPNFAVHVVPNGIAIPPKGHYLVVGSGYSLASYAAGDGTFGAPLPDGGGIALHNVTQFFTPGTRVDAVGFISAPVEFRKRAGLVPSDGITTDGQTSYTRRFIGSESSDSTSNAVDFRLMATDGATYNGVVALLGAPSPQNLAAPTLRDNAQLTISLLDPSVSQNTAPNRQRVGGATPHMLLRRTVTNNTGAPVTRLRFRLTQISTLNNRTVNATNVEADLRAASSLTETTQDSQGHDVMVQGLTLDMPPADAVFGGGMNSSLNADGVVTMAQPLGVGQSLNINLRLNLRNAGTYTFVVYVEALN